MRVCVDRSNKYLSTNYYCKMSLTIFKPYNILYILKLKFLKLL